MRGGGFGELFAGGEEGKQREDENHRDDETGGDGGAGGAGEARRDNGNDAELQRDDDLRNVAEEVSVLSAAVETHGGQAEREEEAEVEDADHPAAAAKAAGAAFFGDEGVP